MQLRRAITLFLGGVALCATLIVVAYERDLSALRTQVRGGGQVAATAAGPIEYAVAGAGLPFLSVHGASGGYDQGLLIGRALVGDTFEIIAPSRFGYLRTPLPADPSPGAQAEAYVALLNALRIDRAIVLGVSAGAPSAVQLVLRHPERVAALILLSPLGYSPDSQAPLPGSPTLLALTRLSPDFVYWAVLRLWPAALTRFLGIPPALLRHAGPDDRRWVDQLLLAGEPLSWRMAGVANDLATRSELRSAPSPLDRVAVPTLIMACSDDLFRTRPAAEYAAAHILNATLVVYPTGGHLFLGHLAEVRGTVLFFIAHLPPPRPR